MPGGMPAPSAPALLRRPKTSPPIPAIPPPITKPATAAAISASLLWSRSWRRQSVSAVTSLRSSSIEAAELLAVLLDRGADLLGRAGRHQEAASVAVTVSRIFFASSIAIVGAGGVPLRIAR